MYYFVMFGSEVLKEYGSKMTSLLKKIVEIVLMCLGDDFEQKFESVFSKGYLRIINYSVPFHGGKRG